MKVGDRAKFISKDIVFHHGQREGKTGKIVELRGDSCYWQLPGDPAVYLTALSDLERVDG